jgi:hypothetical protein
MEMHGQQNMKSDYYFKKLRTEEKEAAQNA